MCILSLPLPFPLALLALFLGACRSSGNTFSERGHRCAPQDMQTRRSLKTSCSDGIYTLGVCVQSSELGPSAEKWDTLWSGPSTGPVSLEGALSDASSEG